jgi:hypothetical protein
VQFDEYVLCRLRNKDLDKMKHRNFQHLHAHPSTYQQVNDIHRDENRGEENPFAEQRNPIAAVVPISSFSAELYAATTFPPIVSSFEDDGLDYATIAAELFPDDYAHPSTDHQQVQVVEPDQVNQELNISSSSTEFYPPIFSAIEDEEEIATMIADLCNVNPYICAIEFYDHQPPTYNVGWR